MSKSQRDKGARGATAAKKLLLDRDWVVDQITAGIKSEDMIATDPSGVVYSCEVKNCMSITAAHKKQAIEQAKARKLPWMLMNKIAGTKYWLIQRRGATPVIWAEKGVSDLI